MKLLGVVLLALSLSQPVPHSVMEKVMKVHVCEENGLGWRVNGSKYQGGLGWLHATWMEFKAPTDPLNMALANIEQQAKAMVKFAAKYGWPDQSGCQYGGY